MHARVSTIQLDPARIDGTVSDFDEQDLPAFRQIAGFRGQSQSPPAVERFEVPLDTFAG